MVASVPSMASTATQARIGNDHRLPDIVLREIAGYRATVVDVLMFLFGRSALGENSGLGQERLQQPCGFLQRDAFIRQNLRYRSEQGIGVAGGEREQKFCQSPVRTDAGKNLLVLHLPGHDGAAHAFALEGLDQLGEFS